MLAATSCFSGNWLVTPSILVASSSDLFLLIYLLPVTSSRNPRVPERELERPEPVSWKFVNSPSILSRYFTFYLRSATFFLI